MTAEVPNQNLSSSRETITHYTHAPTVKKNGRVPSQPSLLVLKHINFYQKYKPIRLKKEVQPRT
jgi:hypothetical protein